MEIFLKIEIFIKIKIFLKIKILFKMKIFFKKWNFYESWNFSGSILLYSHGDKVWDIDKINIFYPGHFFKKCQDNAGSPLASFQFDR